MVWWQGILLILILCAGGASLGFILSFVILRLKKKQRPYYPLFSRNPREKTVAIKYVPIVEVKDKRAIVVDKFQSVIDVKEPIKFASDILLEVETNLRIATKPWTGRLDSFQTKVWDNIINKISSSFKGIREELLEAYADMRLANQIVWLSTDVGRRSKDLDDSYLNLCIRIAERLKRVKTFLVDNAVSKVYV